MPDGQQFSGSAPRIKLAGDRREAQAESISERTVLPDKSHWLIALVGVAVGVWVGEGVNVGVAEGMGVAKTSD